MNGKLIWGLLLVFFLVDIFVIVKNGWGKNIIGIMDVCFSIAAVLFCGILLLG